MTDDCGGRGLVGIGPNVKGLKQCPGCPACLPTDHAQEAKNVRLEDQPDWEDTLLRIESTGRLVDPFPLRVAEFETDVLRALVREAHRARERGAFAAEQARTIAALRTQVRCGHSPWPCECGYKKGGFCG